MSEGFERLEQSSWAQAELGRALVELGRALGWASERPTIEPDADELLRAGEQLGLELAAVGVSAGELEASLRELGPGLVRLPPLGSTAPRFLLLLASGRRCRLLGPDGRVTRIRAATIAERLLEPRLVDARAEVRTLLGALELATDDLVARSFAREKIAAAPIDGVWRLRPRASAPIRALARRAGLPRSLAISLGARAAATASFLALFWLLGRDVFGVGEASLAALIACAAAFVLLRLLDAWAQTRLAQGGGALLKDTLLRGILKLDRGAVAGRGAGQFLSMAMAGESSSSASEGALSLLLSGVELLAALVVLGLGGGPGLALLLLAWLALTSWLCRRTLIAAEAWAARDRAVTHDLIERMVGYQTRLVQERPEQLHEDEDRLLHDYLVSAQELDRRRLPLAGPISVGWLLLGVALLEPALVSGRDPTGTAIAIGGILLAGNALRQLVTSVVQLGDVWIAWRESAPILAAARARERATEPDPAPEPPTDAVLRFDALSLRHPNRATPALRECGQVIARGQRILLEGPSGSGKSTLAVVLAGLREPDAGTVEVWDARGVAIPTARRGERVVLVPQFHDNHILTASLLFNLLLGRGSPPGPDDLADALRVCEQLGLGPLIDRMPQGPSQPIGDGGWVLSHGERSRVCLARALLQARVELLILDESLAALDPDTLVSTGRTLLGSPPTLLIIAHP